MPFKVGEVVQLKAGGPKMTVNQVPREHAQYYRCQWFAGKKLDHGSFQEEELVYPQPDEPKPE